MGRCRHQEPITRKMQRTTLVGFAFWAVISAILPTCGALDGHITPKNEVSIEQGDDIVLQCNLDINENSTQFARDVKWYKYSSPIPENMYREIRPNVSELRWINATIDDSGNYYCGFEGDSLQERPGIVVNVGLLPEAVQNLVCTTHTGLEVLCQWEDAPLNTNLAQHEVAQYRSAGTSWSNADVIGNSCRFKSVMFRNYLINVTTFNSLGSAEAVIQFHTTDQLTPYPPGNLQATPVPADGDFVLHVNWTTPEGLDDSMVRYRVDYVSSQPDGPSKSKDVDGGFRWTDLTSLSAFTEYTIKVSARSIVAHPLDTHLYWSEPAETTATTDTGAPFGIPSNPRIVEELDGSEMSHRSVEVEWDHVPKNQWGSPTINYKVIVMPQDDTPGLSQDEHEADRLHANVHLHNIDKYQTYKMTIQPYNEKGLGESTEFLNVIPDRTSAPDPPQDMKAVLQSDGEIRITWKPPSNPYGLIRHYEVSVKGNAVFSSNNLTDQPDSFRQETQSLDMTVKVQCRDHSDEGESLDVRVSAVTKNYTGHFFHGNESIRMVHNVCMKGKTNVLFIGIFIPTIIIVSCIICLILWNYFRDSCRETPEPSFPSSIVSKNGQLKRIESFPKRTTEKESFDLLKPKVNNISITLDLEDGQQTNLNDYHPSPPNEPKYGLERNHSHDSGVPESPVEVEDMDFTNRAFEAEGSAPDNDSAVPSVSRSISEVSDNNYKHLPRNTCFSDGSGDSGTSVRPPVGIDLRTMSLSTPTDGDSVHDPSFSSSLFPKGTTYIPNAGPDKHSDSGSVGDYVKQDRLEEAPHSKTDAVAGTAYTPMAPLSPPPVTTSVPNGYIPTELLPKSGHPFLKIPSSPESLEDYSQMTITQDKSSDGYLPHGELTTNLSPSVQSEEYIKHQSLSQICQEYQDNYPHFNQNDTSCPLEDYVKHDFMPASGCALNGNPSGTSLELMPSEGPTSTSSSMPYSKVSLNTG